MNLADVAAELQRQLTTKHDYLVPANDIRLAAMPLGDGSGEADMLMLFGEHEHHITKTCHQQLADRLGVPRKYYERMRNEAPGLLADNANHWLANDSDRRLVRCLDGSSRAFLSDRYRRLDNVDFVQALLPAVTECGAQVVSADVSHDRLYVKCVVPHLTADILAPGSMRGKGHDRFDIVQAGLVLSNSETGAARLALQPAIHTVACTNLAVFRDAAVKKSHIGAKAGDDEQGDEYKYMSDETRQATDRALWLQLADLARAALDGRVFNELCDKLREARGLVVHKPVEAVEELCRTNALTDSDNDGILRYLVDGGDLTLYGLHSAVTRHSQDLDDYDRATELELLGGQLIEQRPAYVTAE